MKKALVLVGALLLLYTNVPAQRRCGAQQVRDAIIAKYPEAAQKFEDQKAALQGIADNYKQIVRSSAEEKTTAISPVPVIFHIIVSSAQFTNLGGTAGITQRCDSQIAVLNRDYNKQNLDAGLIPSLWKPLYASVGIHFGLAHTDPNGNGTPGFEVNISSTAFDANYSEAKHASSGGFDAWDETKYLNVWCIYFNDDPGLLGITIPKSDASSGWAPANEVGVCINFEALGKRASPSDHYMSTGTGSNYYDQGRTLTHEIGHYFEIWHTWGDDNGLCPFYVSASCPYGVASGGPGTGSDDGLADTPPEGDYKYGAPAYPIKNGTCNDCCQTDPSGINRQPIGIACLDFMNYTDDIAMQLFTPDQAAAMASMVLVPPGSATGTTGYGVVGESYSLTQNPGLLNWPPNTGVATTTISNDLNIFPNPAAGMIYISFNTAADQLKQVSITNMLGQEVLNMNTAGQQKNLYSIDLSAMSKGIYFVRCNFASGSVTRKISLQ